MRDYLAASVIAPVDRWSLPWFRILSSNFAVMCIAFMAGRLHKVEDNKYREHREAGLAVDMEE